MGSLGISEVRKNFGGLEVLHGVTIDIADGEFVALVGPSGCGKSTLLRMVAGLEELSSGQILINGEDVSDLDPKDRDIAMVFQSYALYPHMTVEKNMGFALKLDGVSRAETKRRVRDAAEMLGLENLLDRHPRNLSGGQRQRVAMGRAIVRAPEVFLFDEPLSNLDAKLRVQMRHEIKQNHQRLGTTTVHVTHDQIEAMTMADRIVVMHDGAIEQIGTPLELYDRPANLFVAGFIGSPAMNMITGRMDGSVFRADDGTRLDVHVAPPGSDHHKVVLGVRPEHFVLDPEGAPATVLTVEPTGSETLVVATFAGKEIVCALRERITAKPGETLRLQPDSHSLHIFDAASGARLGFDDKERQQ